MGVFLLPFLCQQWLASMSYYIKDAEIYISTPLSLIISN